MSKAWMAAIPCHIIACCSEQAPVHLIVSKVPVEYWDGFTFCCKHLRKLKHGACAVLKLWVLCIGDASHGHGKSYGRHFHTIPLRT